MSSKYSHKVPANLRPKVVRLLANFGLSNQEIATATGWSDGLIKNDFRDLGGKTGLMEDMSAKERYAKAFEAYVSRSNFGVHSDVAEHVRSALRVWLEFERIEEGIKAAEKIFAMLSDVPQDGTDVQKLWSWCYRDPDRDHRYPKLSLFTRFLCVVEAKQVKTPSSPEEAIDLIVSDTANTYRRYVAPWLELEDSQAIMAAYGELDERLRCVVGHRFGFTLDGVPQEPKTHQEIGVLMSLSKDRIRQLEIRARQKLATALKSIPRLQRFAEARKQPSVQSVVSMALDRELGRRLSSAEIRISELETQLIEHGFQPRGSVTGAGRWNEHLFKRCDELELSVRSMTCMDYAQIEYVYELVERTEGQMLRSKNFGRKALNEIKEVLHELGLSLGMDLTGFPRPQ